MDGMTSAQLAFAAGFGPAGAKLLHDIANQMFGSATQEPEAYRWCPDPRSNKLLAIDATGRRMYWEWLQNGDVAIVDYDSGHKTTYPAGSLLGQLIPKSMKPTHRPSMPPPSAVSEEVRDMYSVLKRLAEAVFGSDVALEYCWGIDRKYPGQLFVQIEGTGTWRRVALRDDGSFAVHCERTGTEQRLPRKHEVAKLMSKKRSCNNGRRSKSYFEFFVELMEAKGLYRPTLQ